MNLLTLLSLIQKNFSSIGNKTALKRYLTERFLEVKELVQYLALYEQQFHTQYLENKTLLENESVELARLQANGLKFCYPGSALYPKSFYQMPGAPFLLSYEGHPSWLLEKSLAVVGSRDASSLSRNWMEQSLASFLRSEFPVVVSGGARGVDQMAHQLALRNSCPTIVVLPSGLGAKYPQSLEAWKAKVIDGGGCFLSEYPYYQCMLKHHFQDRNRLIAGLGSMTLLVEAKRRSGSLLTAQRTLELGKSVFVVPGHPSDLSHLGNIDLLSEGATPVRDAEDLTNYFRSELRTSQGASPMPSQYSLFQN